MAVTTVVQYGSLSDPMVLAPERYDPRRIQNADETAIALSELVSIENPTLSVKALDSETKYLVLDTGDSFEGVIRPRTQPLDGSAIRSSKKMVKGGDVIISRLRPYLRQVAYVDDALAEAASNVLVSAEFFVLRARQSDESCAWLVPFLLSKEIQAVLGRSQEGGHHPRFNKETLSGLLVPLSVVESRAKASEVTEKHVVAIRKAFLGLQHLVSEIDCRAEAITSKI